MRTWDGLYGHGSPPEATAGDLSAPTSAYSDYHRALAEFSSKVVDSMQSEKMPASSIMSTIHTVAHDIPSSLERMHLNPRDEPSSPSPSLSSSSSALIPASSAALPHTIIAQSTQDLLDLQLQLLLPPNFTLEGLPKLLPKEFIENLKLLDFIPNVKGAGFLCLSDPKSPLGLVLDPAAGHVCQKGFWCPYIDPTDTSNATLPVICPAIPFCSVWRKSGFPCAPQGLFEPAVCQLGYYCPDQLNQIICPEGYFCPTGSLAPTPCSWLSYCPLNSYSQMHYGPLVLVLFIDLIWAFFLWRKKRAEKAAAKKLSETQALKMAENERRYQENRDDGSECGDEEEESVTEGVEDGSDSDVDETTFARDLGKDSPLPVVMDAASLGAAVKKKSWLTFGNLIRESGKPPSDPWGFWHPLFRASGNRAAKQNEGEDGKNSQNLEEAGGEREGFKVATSSRAYPGEAFYDAFSDSTHQPHQPRHKHWRSNSTLVRHAPSRVMSTDESLSSSSSNFSSSATSIPSLPSTWTGSNQPRFRGHPTTAHPSPPTSLRGDMAVGMPTAVVYHPYQHQQQQQQQQGTSVVSNRSFCQTLPDGISVVVTPPVAFGEGRYRRGGGGGHGGGGVVPRISVDIHWIDPNEFMDAAVSGVGEGDEPPTPVDAQGSVSGTSTTLTRSGPYRWRRGSASFVVGNGLGGGGVLGAALVPRISVDVRWQNDVGDFMETAAMAGDGCEEDCEYEGFGTQGGGGFGGRRGSSASVVEEGVMVATRQGSLARRGRVARTESRRNSADYIASPHRPRRKASRRRGSRSDLEPPAKEVLAADQEAMGAAMAAMAGARGSTYTPKIREEGSNQFTDTDMAKLVASWKKGLSAAPNVRMQFGFRDLSFRVKTGRQVLRGVSGLLNSGRMTAIMGPSGSGKTTLLNVLLGKIKPTGGQIRINNRAADPGNYRKVIGYVPQEDTMLTELTVRENILHSARVRLPRDWTEAEIEDHVDNVITILGLEKVSGSPIGDERDRGISGGQRKRVNVGIELAAMPLALLLDEPTSGLDSTSSLLLFSRLASITHFAGLTTVAIIHQPRPELFNHFDDVIMMAPNGKVAYAGPVNCVGPYFDSIGFKLSHANMADQAMDILSSACPLARTPDRIGRVGETLTAEEITKIWEKRWKRLQRRRSRKAAAAAAAAAAGYPGDGDDQISIAVEEDGRGAAEAMDREALAYDSFTSEQAERLFFGTISVLLENRGASFLQQLVYSHNRSLLQQWRNPGSFSMEMFLALVGGFLIGLCMRGGEFYRGVYIGKYATLSPSNQDIVGLAGLLLGFGVSMAGAPSGVKVFAEETTNYWRESASGHSPLAYYLGKVLASTYRFVISALHFTAAFIILAKPMVDFSNQYLIILCLFWGIYGLSYVTSMVVRKEDASLLAVTMGLTLSLMCGFGPNLNQARDWHMLWLFEFSFNKWATEAMYTFSVSYYTHVYDTQRSSEVFGYTLNRTGLDYFMAFFIGALMRVAAFILLVFMNRDKQKDVGNAIKVESILLGLPHKHRDASTAYHDLQPHEFPASMALTVRSIWSSCDLAEPIDDKGRTRDGTLMSHCQVYWIIKFRPDILMWSKGSLWQRLTYQTGVEMFRALHHAKTTHGFPLDLMNKAIERGNINAVEYLWDLDERKMGFEERELEAAMEAAMASGQIQVIQYLCTKTRVQPHHMTAAAKSGQLDALKLFLYSERWSSSDIRHMKKGAIEGGQYDLLEFLCMNTGGFNSVHIALARLRAWFKGSDDVFAHYRGIRRYAHNGAIARILDAGNARLARNLYVRRFQCIRLSIDHLAERGDLECVKAVIRRAFISQDSRKEAHETALVAGHLDVSEYLLTIRRTNEICLDIVVESGDLNIIKHVFKNCKVEGSSLAMDRAAGLGFFDIVKYLHEHWSHGCSEDAMDGAQIAKLLKPLMQVNLNSWTLFCNAVEKGNVGMVRFLLEEGILDPKDYQVICKLADAGYLKEVMWMYERGCKLTFRNVNNLHEYHSLEALQKMLPDLTDDHMKMDLFNEPVLFPRYHSTTSSSSSSSHS
ncbi:hypothetical protein HDU97_005753 [Phlyctochytrium planicorne]|nr:hypothetical protein HDU97_005753 [Phlyctochytrium planicorne]